MSSITLYKGPLVGQLVIRHPDTDEILIEFEKWTLQPGESLTVKWRYPDDGITASA
jgi:hypothetical protein